ncbi:MAG: hypothetical protein CMJ25_13700 [Phycisphaerae bacterium]|nr:hypothetical protein [Phycisphaerae bacterium]
MSVVDFSIPYFPDPTKGRPVFNGGIYIGEPDLDPKIEINQKQVYYILEGGSLVAADQPISTSAGGVPVYNGQYVTLDVEGSYSLRVDDKLGAQVYYVANTADSGIGGSFETATKTEQLAESQTEVVFSGVFVRKANIYIGSKGVDRGRLFENIDYTITDVSTIELADSYPDGTYISATSNELTGNTDNKIQYMLLSEAVANDKAFEGQIVQITDRNNAQFQYLTGQSPNMFNVVAADDALLDLSLIINSKVNSKQFGLKGDGVTDDTLAIQALRDYISDNPSIELVFDEGTYLYSTSPNWAIAKLVAKALGTVTFRNTGTGDCLIFDDPVSTTFNITWCWDNPIFIEGDDNTGHGLYNRSVHHSQIAVNIRGCGKNVQRSEFAVVDEFRITASINQGAWYSATAPDGISLTSNTDTTKETSACIWYNPIIEGVRGVGISLDRAINNQFILGTSEGNVGANVECLQNSRNNKFDGIDLEASGSSQGFIDRGRWNRWVGVFNDANSTVTSDATGSTIRDGIHNAIINDGAYTSIENVNYGAGTGEITDTGTFTTITDAYDLESASIKIPNKVQGKTKFTTTLAVGAFGVTPAVPGNLTKTAVVLPNVKVGDNVDLSSVTVVTSEFTKPTAVCVIDGQIDITFSQLNGVAVSPLPAGGDFTTTVNGK